MKFTTIMIFVIFAITLTCVNCVTVQEFAATSNSFACSVYNKIAKNKDNALMSPVSAEIVLALTQSGAKNGTAEEIRRCLHLSNSEQTTRSAFKTLLGALKGDRDYTLLTANKIYVKDNFFINRQFSRIAMDIYKTQVEKIDFSQKTAAEKINNWVLKQTQNKIHNLVASNSFSQITTLVLVNALYFKGSWIYAFNKYSTKKSKFHKTAKNEIHVDTMYISGKKFGYYKNSNLKTTFLEMKFKGKDVAMVIGLPDEIEGLANLERQIEQVFTIPKFSYEVVDVGLPKFKIETTINFKNILKKLGVKKAFSSKEADFSGIAGHKGNLIISEILQKTFVDVDENGVEAAAATFIGEPRTLVLTPSTSKRFIVDRPFMFYITVKNIAVFVGRISVPKY